MLLEVDTKGILEAMAGQVVAVAAAEVTALKVTAATAEEAGETGTSTEAAAGNVRHVTYREEGVAIAIRATRETRPTLVEEHATSHHLLLLAGLREGAVAVHAAAAATLRLVAEVGSAEAEKGRAGAGGAGVEKVRRSTAVIAVIAVMGKADMCVTLDLTAAGGTSDTMAASIGAEAQELATSRYIGDTRAGTGSARPGAGVVARAARAQEKHRAGTRATACTPTWTPEGAKSFAAMQDLEAEIAGGVTTAKKSAVPLRGWAAAAVTAGVTAGVTATVSTTVGSLSQATLGPSPETARGGASGFPLTVASIAAPATKRLVPTTYTTTCTLRPAGTAHRDGTTTSCTMGPFMTTPLQGPSGRSLR